MANLADLQAELLRKKTELKQRRPADGTFLQAEKKNKTSSEKSLFGKKNKGVESRQERDLEQKAEDERNYENARRKLEAKAKVYDRMARGEGGVLDDEKTGLEDRVMVDFQRKALDHIKEQKIQKEKMKEDEERVKRVKELGGGKVEFTDSLGRTRVLDKEDVKDYLDMDKDLRVSSSVEGDPHSTFQKMKFIKAAEFETELDPEQKEMEREMKKKLLVSSDMQREELRQKWEQEEMDLINKPEVHYQDVQFDEVRDLGTGYFAFARGERERERQKEDLKEAREETLTARERAERVKAKRAEMLKARMAKVKARRGIEDTTIEDDAKEAEKSKTEDEDRKKKEEQQRLLEHHLDLARRAKTREWDQGKEATLQADKEGPSWERKTEEMRNERNPEFAPPDAYNGAAKRSGAAPQRRPPDFKKRREDEDRPDKEEDPVLRGLRSLKNLIH